MTPAFGFSVGDFIAVVRLLIDAIRALDESRGSSSQYRELINELRNLELGLMHVKSIHHKIADVAQQQTLQSQIADCRQTFDRFLSKIRKYDGSLGLGGSISTCKDAFRKVQWRLCVLDELQSFRASIACHVQGIELLLATIQISNGTRAIASLGLQSDGISRIQSSLDVIQGSMSSLTLSLDSTKISASNASASSEMALQSIQDNQKTLMTLLQRVLSQKEASIPAQVLLQQPMMFLDAMNRPMSIQLDWIDSWDAFLAVLKVRFKDSGLAKIEAGEYVIQASKTHRDISKGRPWNVTFLPGQSYDMSMLFPDIDTGTIQSCPHCQYKCQGDVFVDTTCENCKATFRRVVDENHPIHAEAENAPASMKSPARASPVPQRQPSKHSVACIQDFLRVRLFRQTRSDNLAVLRDMFLNLTGYLCKTIVIWSCCVCSKDSPFDLTKSACPTCGHQRCLQCKVLQDLSPQEIPLESRDSEQGISDDDDQANSPSERTVPKTVFPVNAKAARRLMPDSLKPEHIWVMPSRASKIILDTGRKFSKSRADDEVTWEDTTGESWHRQPGL